MDCLLRMNRIKKKNVVSSKGITLRLSRWMYFLQIFNDCLLMIFKKNIDQKLTDLMTNTQCIIVPYHGGGRIKKINAWYLNTLMVYL
jgi:hypothetical protein